MKLKTVINKCSICGNPYKYGPGIYEGHKLDAYAGVFCCESCWKFNWDGWSPHYESVLLDILKRNNLPVPKRNSNGLLPRN